jgi:hypothetical protein
VGSAVVVTRAAQPADFERLRELTFESKAHWGYDHDLVRGWADGLEFPTGCERWAAELGGRIVAWAGLTPPAGGVAVLDDRARELGAERLEWSAEPNAVGFYEKVGGRKLRDHVTEWGRLAPWMGLDL